MGPSHTTLQKCNSGFRREAGWALTDTGRQIGVQSEKGTGGS